ncbi:Hydrogenase maturation factor HypB [bioreactor metagenome]|uniref:Hydrogenase maturation factor HypB n=1 Tax=bioreactor metagenome TaxID=1076179 RepID=A0A644SV37_9ZZZZ|nr:hydrogenase nickel incorporation protein HypB [Negativicutes bacterium]
MEVKVMTDILDANDQLAHTVNQKLSSQGIFVLNLLGSPGCGKTTLLEKTIAALKADIRLAVIEGDLFTSKDAERIERQGVPVIQINTAGGCHLDAGMINSVISGLDLSSLDMIIIENVGNLVCPAEFEIGEDAKATVLSVTEGEDKPLKYPLVFRKSQAVLINKIDLLPYTDFDLDAAMHDIKGINPEATLVTASCRTGQGLDEWYHWLKTQVKKKQNRSSENGRCKQPKSTN